MKNAAKRAFTCKGRCRYSRKRAKFCLKFAKFCLSRRPALAAAGRALNDAVQGVLVEAIVDPHAAAIAIGRAKPKLRGSIGTRDRTKRTIQIGVRSEILEAKENHEEPFHRSGIRPKIQEGAGEKGSEPFKIQEFPLENSKISENFNIF